MSDAFHLVVFVVLEQGGEILLARRSGVSRADGLWCLPGGHVEHGETLAVAAAREVREEVGVAVLPEDLEPAGVCHYVEDGVAGIDVYFRARRFGGTPHPVSECDAVRWCAPGRLPVDVVAWLPAAVQHHLVDGHWFRQA